MANSILVIAPYWHAGTWVFDAPDVVTALAAAGYHTVCVGGVGFFNQRSPLGRVLPGLFAERHWSPELGVTNPASFEAQLDLIDSITSAGPDPLSLAAAPQPCPSMWAPTMYISFGVVVPTLVQ